MNRVRKRSVQSPLFRRSLEIYEINRGKDHPDVAGSLNNLAGLFESMGQYAKSERFYRRSLEIREKRLGVGFQHIENADPVGRDERPSTRQTFNPPDRCRWRGL